MCKCADVGMCGLSPMVGIWHLHIYSFAHLHIYPTSAHWSPVGLAAADDDDLDHLVEAVSDAGAVLVT